MKRSRRNFFSEFAKGLAEEISHLQAASPEIKPTAPAPAANAPEAPGWEEPDSQVMERIYTLLGGEQDRRSFLQRMTGAVASLFLAGPAVAAGASQDMAIQEAAALFDICRKAAAKTTIMEACLNEHGDVVRQLVLHGPGYMLEKVKMTRLDTILDMSIFEGMEDRSQESIEAFIRGYETMKRRHRELRGDMARLYDFIAQRCPKGKIPEDYLPSQYRLGVNEEFYAKMDEGLEYAREYLAAYRDGSLLDWMEKQRPGSYEEVRDTVEGKDYTARPISDEERVASSLKSIDTMIRKHQLKVDMTITHSEEPGSASIRSTQPGGHHDLRNLSNLLRRAYPELVVTPMGVDHRDMFWRINQKDKSEANAPRLLIENPPRALSEVLQKHTRSITASNYAGVSF